MLTFTGGLINAVQTTMYALATNVYPSVIRATGVGTAVAIGRLGAILSGYAGAWALEYRGSVSYFGLMASAMAVCFLALAALRRHVGAARPATGWATGNAPVLSRKLPWQDGAGMSEFLSLHEAIAALVQPGDRVALEGFTHLIPFAAGHEIIRQDVRDLTLIRMTPDLLYDQMIGCGCARKLIFSWGGNPGVGSLHRLRDAVEHGWPRPLEIEEHSHSAMAHAYAAGAAGMPSAFFRGYAGSDLPGVNPEHQVRLVSVHR